MYFATWSVEIPEKFTVTLTQENGEWLTINVPSDAVSVVLYVDISYDPAQPAEEPTDPDPTLNEPDTQPPRILSLGASNFCSRSGTIALGTPTDPEYLILAANAGVGFSGGVTSAEPQNDLRVPLRPSLYATLDRTGLNQCGIDKNLSVQPRKTKTA